MERSALGFRLRMVGLNLDAARGSCSECVHDRLIGHEVRAGHADPFARSSREGDEHLQIVFFTKAGAPRKHLTVEQIAGLHGVCYSRGAVLKQLASFDLPVAHEHPVEARYDRPREFDHDVSPLQSPPQVSRFVVARVDHILGTNEADASVDH